MTSWHLLINKTFKYLLLFSVRTAFQAAQRNPTVELRLTYRVYSDMHLLLQWGSPRACSQQSSRTEWNHMLNRCSSNACGSRQDSEYSRQTRPMLTVLGFHHHVRKLWIGRFYLLWKGQRRTPKVRLMEWTVYMRKAYVQSAEVNYLAPNVLGVGQKRLDWRNLLGSNSSARFSNIGMPHRQLLAGMLGTNRFRKIDKWVAGIKSQGLVKRQQCDKDQILGMTKSLARVRRFHEGGRKMTYLIRP